MNELYLGIIIIIVIFVLVFLHWLWVHKKFKRKKQELLKEYPNGVKWKGSAIALNLFFGFFSWLYTYRKDKWKFWLTLLLLILIGIYGSEQSLRGAGYIIWIISLVDHIRRPKEFYWSYYTPSVRMTQKLDES